MKRALIPFAVAVVLSPSPLLAAKVPVSGRAVDASGKGVAGAKVLLVPVPTAAEQGKLELAGKIAPEPAVTAVTDAAGAFQVTAPDAGMWKVRIEARGLVPLEMALTPLVDETELADAKLPPDTGIKVTVTTPAGKPAAGARVRIADGRRPLDLDGWSVPIRLATAGADGTAALPKAAEESLIVEAGTPGFPLAERKSVRGGALSIRLAAGQTRHLQVRDAKGKGVAGVAALQGDWALGRTCETGALDLVLPDGNGADLRLEAEDGRSLDYRLRKKPTPPAPPAAAAETAPDVAVLPDNVPLAGRIVSARDGHPLAGALAWLNAGSAVRTGTDGSFRLNASPNATVYVNGAASGFFAAYVEAGGSHKSPSLALKPRLAATGVVVDEAGRGLPGVALKATAAPGRMRTTSDFGVFRSGGFARSGAGGRFRLANLAAGSPYRLLVSLAGFAPAQLEIPSREDGQVAAELRITLRVGQGAFGTVLDGNHAAVAGAQVKLRPAAGSDPLARLLDRGGPGASRFEAVTGAQGRFTVSHVPVGSYDLTVQARGFAPLTVPGLAIPEGKSATDLGTVVLSAGSALEGRVADPDGHPIEGAEVRAAPGSSRDLFRMSREPGPPDAFTAADGSFRLEDRAPGEALDLAVSHPSYGPASLPGVVVPTAEPLLVVLQPRSRVSGRAVGKDGKAIAGTQVTLSEIVTSNVGGRSFQRPGNWKQAATDEDGAFAYADVAPGGLTIEASAPNHQQAELKGLEVKPGQELAGLELVLPPAAMVEGRVVAPDGQPVAGAEVTVVSSASSMGMGFSDLFAQTDGDGRYSLDGVPAGSRTLEARADHYRRAVRDLEVKEGSNTADFTLESGYEVSGRVVDEAGTAVASVQLTMIAGRDMAGLLSALSGPDGAFRFEGVTDGTFRLMARKPGYAANPQGDTVTVSGASVGGVEVKLAAGGTLTGKISGAEFSQLARVVVTANRGRPGQVDADGIYHILNVPPGEWTVSATVPDTSLHAEGRVTLEPGMAEAKLDLQFGKGFTLSGVVLHNGTPLPGASLELTRTGTFSQNQASSDHQGAFQFGGLDAGAYELTVRTAGGSLHKEKVDLTADRQIEVNVQSASLAGRVIDSTDSSPVADAQVSLEPADGKEPYFQPPVATDSRGAFRLPEVTDGAWKLRVSHEGYSPAVKDVQVAGADAADLEVSLSPTEGLTLMVVLPGGQSPERIRAGALDAAGHAVASGYYPVGENGRVRLSDVPPGSWQIFVDSDYAAPASVAATAPGPAVQVVLPPAGMVRVKVPTLTKEDTAATLTLTGPGGAYRTFDYSGQITSQWDLYQGAQSFTRIPVGTWQLLAKTPDGRTFKGTAAVTAGSVVDVVLK
ncbi:MAG TPA: carboxypeptidase-like regulatory domain-containing protein [Thermoanaerobaculia bacterium]|nr:carboxypeptidase-like regulatory domain-containing protein [Thermoanaerobaculia bacterium]